jgi:hypothetical protein
MTCGVCCSRPPTQNHLSFTDVQRHSCHECLERVPGGCSRDRGAQIRVPVAVTCRVLKIARQPFYRWFQNPVSTRDWDDAQLANAALDAHAEAPTFGYRLIADELADLGYEVWELRVWRLCSKQGNVSTTTTKKRGKSGKHGAPVHADLVQRQLGADRPNQLWLTDFTEHCTGEGKLCVCAIKAMFSNRIVGYHDHKDRNSGPIKRVTKSLSRPPMRLPCLCRRCGCSVSLGALHREPELRSR